MKTVKSSLTALAAFAPGQFPENPPNSECAKLVAINNKAKKVVLVTTSGKEYKGHITVVEDDFLIFDMTESIALAAIEAWGLLGEPLTA